MRRTKPTVSDREQDDESDLCDGEALEAEKTHSVIVCGAGLPRRRRRHGRGVT
jgi:hypothetical protein